MDVLNDGVLMQVIATQHPDVLLLRPRYSATRAASFSRATTQNVCRTRIDASSCRTTTRARQGRAARPALSDQPAAGQAGARGGGRGVRRGGGPAPQLAAFRPRRQLSAVGRDARDGVDSAGVCARLPGAVGACRVSLQDHDYYAPQFERSLLWNDPALNIAWPLDGAPLLSAKDQAGLPLAGCEVLRENLAHRRHGQVAGNCSARWRRWARSLRQGASSSTWRHGRYPPHGGHDRAGSDRQPGRLYGGGQGRVRT